MFKEKTFQIALFISVFVHAAVLYQLPQLEVNIHKSIKQLEVTYQQLKTLPAEIKVVDKKTAQYPPQYQDKIQVVKSSQNISSFMKDKFNLDNFKIFQSKPKVAKVDASQKKKTIKSTLDSKMDNPLYKTYYEQIRDKIKSQAYKNYTKYEEGEVYLSFVVSSAGELVDTKLFKEKSSQNDFLQDVAVKSVKQAAPFPKFPADLNFPQLSFNVIISFELGE